MGRQKWEGYFPSPFFTQSLHLWWSFFFFYPEAQQNFSYFVAFVFFKNEPASSQQNNRFVSPHRP